MLNRRRPAAADGHPICVAPPARPEKLPRRFGDFLLTSRIDEDALGSAYRAIGEKHDFVRLHVFDSRELPRTLLADTLRANGWYVGTLSGAAIPRGVRMGSALGVPWLAWSEADGWPLHALIRGLRDAGRRLPLEHSVLIADRLAAALESAQKTKLDREPVRHGLVWPGFVSIGQHGDVRMAGFGIAAAVLPALKRRRLAEEVAPYVAPEERSEGRVGENSDLYSIGAILLELLTGRPPRGGTLRADLRSEDGIPPGLERVLRVCLAPEEFRFFTTSAFRRELGRVIVGAGLEPSSYRMASDLRKLCDAPLEITPAAESPRAPTDAEIDRTLDDLWKRPGI